MKKGAFFGEARRSFYAALLDRSVLCIDKKGIASNADKHSKPSINVSRGIFEKIGTEAKGARLAGQMAGSRFEEIVAEYLKQTFSRLNHMRPGNWEISKGSGSRRAIAQFDQYAHLAVLDDAAIANPELSAALGSDYLIKPDIVIIRFPEPDENINVREFLVSDGEATYTSLRKANSELPILHASISCKWTLRSDRAQNARSEGLNLVRNRKGRLPHIVVVTGEPMPNRIASIALGTGDIDCVYHFALQELRQTVEELSYEDASEMLDTMINGKRLKDISDLPLDLVV